MNIQTKGDYEAGQAEYEELKQLVREIAEEEEPKAENLDWLLLY